MDSVSINIANLEEEISSLRIIINQEIKYISLVRKNEIFNALENSSGDFVDAIKEQVAAESAILISIGDLLLEMIDFVQSAANALMNVDTRYSNPKVENEMKG